MIFEATEVTVPAAVVVNTFEFREAEDPSMKISLNTPSENSSTVVIFVCVIEMHVAFA